MIQLLYALILSVFVPSIYADSDFQRRYGSNSQIFDNPLYYTHNTQLICSCCQPQHTHHRRCTEKCEDESGNVVIAQTKKPGSKFSNYRTKNKTIISEKAKASREKQEQLESERKKLEAELAALNTSL